MIKITIIKLPKTLLFRKVIKIADEAIAIIIYTRKTPPIGAQLDIRLPLPI